MEYTIDFYSNWLIGSGLGGNSKDGIVLKDDGCPFIPGRTLKGLFRDAFQECGFGEEEEINLLGHRKHGVEVNEKKKENRQGKLYFGSAYLPNDLRVNLEKQSKEFINGLYSSKTSNCLSDSKQTVNHSLRNLEVIIPLKLEAKLTPLESDSEICKDYKDDLKKALSMIKLMGEKRHRGLGRCIVTFKNSTDDNL